MVIPIDFDIVAKRIVTILESDTAIYQSKKEHDGKLRKIYFGEDSGKQPRNSMLYALVTTVNTPFQTNDRFGIGDGTQDSQHTLSFLIRVYSKHERPQKAEELLW